MSCFCERRRTLCFDWTYFLTSHSYTWITAQLAKRGYMYLLHSIWSRRFMLIEDDTEYSRRSSGPRNKCRYSPPTKQRRICGWFPWDQWTSNKCLTIWMRAIAIRTRHSQHLTPELSDSDRPVSIVSVFLHKTCICSLIASFTFTGWTYQAQDKQQRTLGLGKSKPSSRNLISSKTSGRFSVHGVPYSEHSSFPVSIVKCATIVLMI